jgi:hypothetical protein
MTSAKPAQAAEVIAVEAILSPEQVRVWRLYLDGGALAFQAGRMGVDQILAVRRDQPRRAR